MTLNRLQITTKKLKQADPHFVHSQPGITLKETHLMSYRTTDEYEAQRRWGLAVLWAGAQVSKFPVLPLWASEVWQPQVSWTNHSLRKLMSSWHICHVSGKVGNVWKGERRMSLRISGGAPQHSRKEAFLYLLSQISAEKGPAPATFLTQGKTCHCLPTQPPCLSSHLSLRQVRWSIIYTQ